MVAGAMVAGGGGGAGTLGGGGTLAFRNCGLVISCVHSTHPYLSRNVRHGWILFL